MNRLGLDNLPPVTEDEALELMCYHLQMAAIYYQNTPSDAAVTMLEAQRVVCRDDDQRLRSPHWLGAEAFIKASARAHEVIRRKGLEVEVSTGIDGAYWTVMDDEGAREAWGGPFDTRMIASKDHDQWCAMEGRYSK